MASPADVTEATDQQTNQTYDIVMPNWSHSGHRTLSEAFHQKHVIGERAKPNYGGMPKQRYGVIWKLVMAYKLLHELMISTDAIHWPNKWILTNVRLEV